MAAPYTPLAIANEFIVSFGARSGIEHMKLQKLVYCAYGWWLAAHGMEGDRLTTEGPEIWRHGPVFSSLYRVLKIFGSEPIRVAQSVNPFREPDAIDEDDDDAKPLVAWIWGRYGHLSSFALSDLTHRPGTPWQRVAAENNFRVPFNTEIPDQYIFEEFTKLMNNLPETAVEVELGGDDRRQRQTAT